jgi:hypothetical protein
MKNPDEGVRFRRYALGGTGTFSIGLRLQG